MEQNIAVKTCYCGHCRRELPVESFYTRGATQRPDCYCIACRKEMNRTRYRKSHLENRVNTRPSITDVADDAQRMALILHALSVVRESAARKQRKLREKELANETASSPQITTIRTDYPV